ncbi:hypothetical protein Syun_023109 [Stephania yunnanensis]|uniref:Uncharacterized protein n=1 Tax=Stephania yunnanensis TaxID=152371 RepID=A0AAP0HZ89_9MAGN
MHTSREPHHGLQWRSQLQNLRLSSSLRAIHRAVELRRSHASLSIVVVSRQRSIGPTTRHRAAAAIAAAVATGETLPLLAGVLRAAACRLPRSRATSRSAAAAGRSSRRVIHRRDCSPGRTLISLELTSVASAADPPLLESRSSKPQHCLRRTWPVSSLLTAVSAVSHSLS